MPKIANIETIPFCLPMSGALSWGQASKMETVEHVLVRITTDTGHTGLAEAPPRPTIYGETPQSIQTIRGRQALPRVSDASGTNALRFRACRDQRTNRRRDGRDGGIPHGK